MNYFLDFLCVSLLQSLCSIPKTKITHCDEAKFNVSTGISFRFFVCWWTEMLLQGIGKAKSSKFTLIKFTTNHNKMYCNVFATNSDRWRKGWRNRTHTHTYIHTFACSLAIILSYVQSNRKKNLSGIIKKCEFMSATIEKCHHFNLLNNLNLSINVNAHVMCVFKNFGRSN